MITDDKQLNVTMERIRRFQTQRAYLRMTELNADNFHAAASGYLAEIDRMQGEIRIYLSTHPNELETIP